MVSEVSVKCEVFKHRYQTSYLVKIRTLEGYVWEGVFEKDKVFDLSGVASEFIAVKGRVHAAVMTHTSVYASIELPVDNAKIGKRINVPLNLIWPPPSSG